MKNTATPIEAGTPDHRNAYDSPRLTLIGNATELVLGFSDLDGGDYFGYTRSEFEFEPDGEDADAR
jgi:hypothetical protein